MIHLFYKELEKLIEKWTPLSHVWILVIIMATSSFTFPCGIRGYHYYKTVWNPIINEQLDCDWEFGNVYDRFAIKVQTPDSTIVGHLPMELSRGTQFLMGRGAGVVAEVTSRP